MTHRSPESKRTDKGFGTTGLYLASLGQTLCLHSVSPEKSNAHYFLSGRPPKRMLATMYQA